MAYDHVLSMALASAAREEASIDLLEKELFVSRHVRSGREDDDIYTSSFSGQGVSHPRQSS
jgi:hypothetical protein